MTDPAIRFLTAANIRQTDGFRFSTWPDILRAANDPFEVPKIDAPCIAAHAGEAKTKEAAIASNAFTLCWADLDDTPMTIDEVVAKLVELGFGKFLVYTTSSHANGHGNRYRVLLPLSQPCTHKRWHALQYRLMHELGGDECALRASQINFLPIAGEHYAHQANDGPALNPLDELNPFVRIATRQALERELDEARRQQMREEAAERRKQQAGQQTTNGSRSTEHNDVIGAWNKAYPIERVLRGYGYEPPEVHGKGGDKWIGPESISREPGVHVSDGSMWSEHTSDPCCDQKQHDSFDVMRIRTKNGDYTAAVKAAAARLGMTVGREADGASNGGANPVILDQWIEPIAFDDSLPPVPPLLPEMIPAPMRGTEA